MEKCRDWTTEEDCYIRNHWKCQNDAEMAAALNRSETATSARRKELHCSKQRPWTQEETEYLQEKWGGCIGSRYRKEPEPHKICDCR